MAAAAAVLAATALVAACGSGGGGSDDAGAGPGGGSGTGGTGSASAGSYTAGPGPQGGTALYADFRARKQLLLHGRNFYTVTPEKFAARLATMEAALPFDGAFLQLPLTGARLTRGAVVKAADVAADLQPLYPLRPTRLKYNFAIAQVTSDLDPFDDWTPVVTNFQTLAKVARDAGLVGIVVDNENLAGLRVNYPYDVRDSAGKTVEQYREQVRANSRRIMQAITAEFPDAVVVVLRGPAGGEAKSPASLVNCESRDAAFASPDATCGASPAALLGPFFAGFVEGAGARALLVDGGTDYGLRLPAQFAASADWRKNGLAAAATESPFVPEALRAAWPLTVKAAFGVRELDGARGNGLRNDTAIYSRTLAAALKAADHLVWASFDLTDLTTAAAADPWVAAVANGKTLAAAGATAPPASGSGSGLLAEYYSQIDESELVQTLVDSSIDNVWDGTGPSHTVLAGQADNFSVVWSGTLEAPVTGTYTFYATTDDGMRITLGDTTLLDVFYYQAPTEHVRTIDLVAGQRYAIKIRYFQGGGNTVASFAWQPPGGTRATVPYQYLYPY